MGFTEHIFSALRSLEGARLQQEDGVNLEGGLLEISSKLKNQLGVVNLEYQR
jgi:hypothetical protein